MSPSEAKCTFANEAPVLEELCQPPRDVFASGGLEEKHASRGLGACTGQAVGWAVLGWASPLAAAVEERWDLLGLSEPRQRVCYSASGSSAVSAAVLVPKEG